MVLDLSETTKYKVFTLNRPNRVVVDLYRSAKSNKLKSTLGNNGLISKVRIANNTIAKLRVVIETEEIVFYKTSSIPSRSNSNFRIVIDLKKAYQGSKKLVSAALNKKKMIIAIDPGHGGKDEGARGKKVKEKDLVLKIAKRLKSLIDNEKSMRAILIRDDDSYPC
ncbi:MAG: AMIN domain-containing protein, partial [Gammaproteobacteria bacterium]|nr:AMIN domain-containing protein [Gammaproteobacteria bacterium]